MPFTVECLGRMAPSAEKIDSYDDASVLMINRRCKRVCLFRMQIAIQLREPDSNIRPKRFEYRISVGKI